MNRFDRALHQLVLRGNSVHAEPLRRRPEIARPGDRRPPAHIRTAALYLAALAGPALVAAGLVPLRSDHAGAAALVMVLPVVAIAAIGTTGPAVAAAVSAAVAFDVLLTEPYYRLVIADADDIAAAVALGLVALVVGLLSSRLAHLAVRDSVRHSELDHLVEFIAECSTSSGPEARASACGHLSELLGLTRCEYLDHLRDPGGPLLTAAGEVTGAPGSLRPDRAQLPAHVYLPVAAGHGRGGFFELSSRPGQVTSVEERRTAAAIGRLYGLVLLGA